MAFKRTSFNALKRTRAASFESTYKLSKKVKFEIGSDVYVIPLGLDSGFYETFCHRVETHKVDGQIVGFGGATFGVNIKCKGIDADGNYTSSLCCDLAKKERERFPESNDFAKRIISSKSSRVYLPVLILGNTLADDSKISYPISKVALLKDLKSNSGLKFSYLDMATSSFNNDIVLGYGKKLKEDGEIEYDMDEGSEEFFEEIRQRLSRTVIKVHGVAKQGFTAALKEYSFFSFDNKVIAKDSGEEERNAIINYSENDEIMAKVNEYLQLFDIEVDSLVKDWTEKDLMEYYNSATGVALDSKIETSTPVQEEKVEVLATVPSEPVNEAVSDSEMEDFLSNPLGSSSSQAVAELDDDLEDMLDDEDAFFAE